MLKQVLNYPGLASEVFYDELGDEILKITDTSINYSKYKIISNYKSNNKNSFSGFDTTSYNVYDLDSSVYSGIYEEWIWTDLTGFYVTPFTVGDINKDGITEFYGRRYDTRTNPRTDYWGIAEYDPSNEKIIEKHIWVPSVFDLFVYNGPIYDIDKDDNDEVYMIGVALYDTLLYYYGRSYKENPETGLATDINFDFRDWGQINDTEFGDFDGDNFTDIVYFMSGPSTIKIGKFNPGIVNFDSTFWYGIYPEAVYAGGYSTGDVDNDGFADIVLATSRGIIWVYEYQPDIENYVRIFEADAGIYNTYTHFNTNDIDGNGKIEFWVGGDAFFDGEAITRYLCFESDGNNSYKPVHMIELRGIFSTNAYNAFVTDIDKDGKSEIGFCHDQTFYIFKFTGSPNNPQYELFYFLINSRLGEPDYVIFYGGIMYDVDNDGFPEIIINQSGLEQIGSNEFDRYDFSLVYKPTSVVSVDYDYNINLPNEYKLYQNYPNPFNPTTNISFELPAKSYVTLKIYNMLGELVSTLVNRDLEAGIYTELFSAANLSSGIYILSFSANSIESDNNFFKSQKLILTK